MKAKSGFKITGHLVMKKNGIVVVDEDNLVVDDGMEWVAARLNGASVNAGYFQVGTDDTGPTAPVATQEALVTFLDEIPIETAVVTGKQIVYTATWGPNDGNGAIKESGVFTDLEANSPVMIARRIFAEINKTTDDTIESIWTFTIS